MKTADTYVRARIDTHTKELATDALNAMGLSVSDAIRLLMIKIAEERCLPFSIKAPNIESSSAIAELEAGKGVRFNSIGELIEDINADN